MRWRLVTGLACGSCDAELTQADIEEKEAAPDTERIRVAGCQASPRPQLHLLPTS